MPGWFTTRLYLLMVESKSVSSLSLSPVNLSAGSILLVAKNFEAEIPVVNSNNFFLQSTLGSRLTFKGQRSSTRLMSHEMGLSTVWGCVAGGVDGGRLAYD